MSADARSVADDTFPSTSGHACCTTITNCEVCAGLNGLGRESSELYPIPIIMPEALLLREPESDGQGGVSVNGWFNKRRGGRTVSVEPFSLPSFLDARLNLGVR